MQPSSMQGKAVLVTGVSGSIARAAALRLAEAGANICLVDFPESDLAPLAEKLRALGVQAHIQLTDLTDADACAAAVAGCVAAFGRLDALCNGANAFMPARTTNMPKRDWDLSIAVNLSAPFWLIQAAIPHLLKTNGAIVNITSCVATMAQPYAAAYAASKAGFNQMTKALAAEFIRDSIRINAVSLGSMPMDAGSVTVIPTDLDMALFQKTKPQRGQVTLEEAADLIAFLASDAARPYHGAILSIDNGISLG